MTAMLKASGQTGDGRPLVVLGLSEENVSRLVAQKPVRLDLADVGLSPTEVVIVYGQTEADIEKKLAESGLLGPDAIRLTP